MTPDHWLLKNLLPSIVNNYCFQLYKKYQFRLKITAPRKTKLGDYRFRASNKTHLITINCNLNPYAFLIVYLHEVAHCITTIKHGVTHFRITLDCYTASCITQSPVAAELGPVKWPWPSELDNYPLNATGRQIADMINRRTSEHRRTSGGKQPSRRQSGRTIDNRDRTRTATTT